MQHSDDCYSNQSLYCQKYNFPLFAFKACPHCNKNLTEVLIEKRGLEDALIYSATTLITSCPNCGKTWCD